MNPSVQRWKDRLYDPQRGWVDGTTRFDALIRSRLRPEMTILDLGAGPGTEHSLAFRGACARVVGLDPDSDISRNPNLEDRVRATAEGLPFRAASFDLVFSDWVLEHLPDPKGAVADIARILRPGGVFLFRTVNLNHYAFAIASRTPQWFHRLVANRVRGLPAEAADPHPTFYRMNTRVAVRRVFEGSGLVEDELLAVEAEPSYLMFSVPAFFVGVAYERLVNRWSALSPLRGGLFGCYRKLQ